MKRRRRIIWFVGVNFIYKKQENFNMKTLKRIIAVLLLFITILAVSYVVYTVKQISPENTISEVLYEIAKTT